MATRINRYRGISRVVS